ncbi:MAG: glycoside hydrolase family 88 protein [Clostridia bacterium]|nr:glycoside hydrolase family 88 protein [Clostridia bacterium]
MYDKIISANKSFIDQTWEKLDGKLKQVAVRSRDKIPYTTVNGVHDDRQGKSISWWTNGFWGGLMWLMYLGSKNEEYRITAENAERLMDAAFANVAVLHHDVGFMWHIMSGANYRLTGNAEARNRNLLAAMTLASRYNISGKYIRSWNGDMAGWTIIDCMMNIPLLYWASRELGDPRFEKIAVAHADMAMRDHVRPDGSVAHIVSHDVENGDVIETLAGQGYAVGSSWSRGVAWALYGFVLSYIHTKKVEYLDTAKRVAHYFITNLVADDWLPIVDFRAPEEPKRYDSTAGAVAACGLIEIAKCVPEGEQKIYLDSAIKLLRAMEERFCNWQDDEDSVLQMGTERYNSDGKGDHIPIIYGDYFFVEAILKLRGEEFLAW